MNKTEKFISKARLVHGMVYSYDKVNYVGFRDKVLITCPTHGDFSKSPSVHLSGQGCPRCSIERRVQNSKMSIVDVLSRFRDVHGDKYDYSKVKYTNSKTPVVIICSEHGEFEQLPFDHSRGIGCAACAHVKKLTTQEWIEKAKSIHGELYGYEKVVYRGSHQKIIITCPIHGDFSQTAKHHTVNQQGCPECGKVSPKRRLQLDEFISRSIDVHGKVYDYSEVLLDTVNAKVKVGCPQHGFFSQTVWDHLCGSGCPKCVSTTSVGENEVRDFILSLGVDVIQSDRTIISPKEIDLYLPEYKIGIEYCGLYWHSEQVGKEKHYHQDKFDAAHTEGVRLITMFEDEWKNQQETVKSFLRHLVGKSPRGAGGRSCTIDYIDWKTARDFLNKHHLQGAGRAGKYRIGAFDGDTLVAVMVFGSPSDERGTSTLIEMKRFVTDKFTHPGLGSKMMKWASDKLEFTDVIAFVDRRWFTGDFKKHSNFSTDTIVEPGFYWTNGTVRVHRRYKTKASLMKQYGFDPSMTKLEMMNRLGYYRIFDCGKIKMRWKV